MAFQECVLARIHNIPFREGRIGKTYIRGENCLFYGNDTFVNPAKYLRISLDEMTKNAKCTLT